MKKHLTPKNLRIIHILVCYYGLLQSLHLLTLARAGFILFIQRGIPFPILPPPGGWHTQTLPFLFGLAAVDLVAIITGIIFAYRMVFADRFDWLLGVLSLTIATASAIVFGVGTFSSNAWATYPTGYWIMVILFTPVIILYVYILDFAQKLHMDH